MKARVTYEQLRAMFSYNARTGEFVRLKRCGNQFEMQVAGYVAKDGRVSININGVIYRAHRLAWLYVTGQWPTGEIDHKDTNASNNRWLNLRDVTSSVNKQNKRRAQAGKKYSPLLGAQWCKQAGKWKSSIRVSGRIKCLGFFPTDAAAHFAYVAAKRVMHEGCTL